MRNRVLGWLICLASVIYLVVSVSGLLQSYFRQQAYNKIFNQDEAAALMRDCQVEAVILAPEGYNSELIGRSGTPVNEFIVNGKHRTTADNEFLEHLAQEVAAKCGKIKITDYR